MGRAEQMETKRMMLFEDLHERRLGGRLTQAEAAELLGMSERTFRRWEVRHDAEGAEGLADRRLGNRSSNAVPADTISRVLELFETRYVNYTIKHFHEKLVEEHGFSHSYNWLRTTLHRSGLRDPAPRRGAHRRKVERRPLPGMLVHQDGSRHLWTPGAYWDLIVTLDDATGEILSAFFVDQEGTMSSFRGLAEVIGSRGLFCTLYTDRGSHYWHTPTAGGKVDKDRPTQVKRALDQLGIDMIAAYSPQARGRSERMFGTLQGRLPQELATAGITDMEEANRFLADRFPPNFNRLFARAPEAEGTAFVPFAGDVRDILCVQEERVVGNDNTVVYRRLRLQIEANGHRPHYAKTRVRVHEYPEGDLAIFHGPRCIGRYGADGAPLATGGEALERAA